jgi:hypothetical protein
VHPGPGERIAELVRHLVDRQPLTAEGQHLRHERQVLELSVLIEGREDLLGTLHLDDVTHP